MARLSDDSLEDTEQVQAIVRSIGRPESFEPAAIGQPLGIAGSAGRERIGQRFAAQQATEAQHDFEAA